MDAAGAQKLQWRIEQQQHWRRAEAVADGRQPAVDPDHDALETFGGDLRVYAGRVRGVTEVRVCKRLVDGMWESSTLETPLEAPGERDVARVA